MLKHYMEDTEFLISFYIVKVFINVSIFYNTIYNLLSVLIEFFFQFLFSFCFPLCKQLQKVQIDLKKTITIVENVVITLKTIRDNYKTEFSQIYINVKVNNLKK